MLSDLRFHLQGRKPTHPLFNFLADIYQFASFFT